MAPVPRVAHLAGDGGVRRDARHRAHDAVALIALPFFDVDLAQADWATAAVVMLVGSFSLIGLGILAGVLPLIYPERGEQLSFMVQASVLLVSGVYYSVEVLPGWLQAFSWLSPATYLLEGVRAAIIDGAGVADVAGDLVALVAVRSACSIPLLDRRVRGRRAVGQAHRPPQAPGVAAGAESRRAPPRHARVLRTRPARRDRAAERRRGP